MTARKPIRTTATGVNLTIYEDLLKHRLKGRTVIELADVCYPGNTAPPTFEACIRSSIYRLRKWLQKRGQSIECVRTHYHDYARYRLVKLPQAAE